MEVIDFANDYPNERERVFKTLEGCKNIEQIGIAKNYFNALKQKWTVVMDKNSTVRLMVEVDEQRFMNLAKQKETDLY
jgi:hypothetical protein